MEIELVSRIKSLKSDKVHIKDPQRVNEILNGIIDDGFDNLQVVSDFDLTITKQHENGKRHATSYRLFEQCPSVTQQYKDMTSQLMHKYFPMEYNTDRPHKEKIKLMDEWWQQSEKALIGLKVPLEELDTVVANISTSLRDGTEDFFISLLGHNVPVLVFSAGLGDIVASILKLHKVDLPNVKVVSNFFKYDDTGTILGFQGPLIHVLNKNEFAIKNSVHYDLVKNRKNIILMGDSRGDSRMADGMEDNNHVLKIGFIYEKVEGNLPAYLETFDIVLEDDQTMDIPRNIIDMIEKRN